MNLLEQISTKNAVIGVVGLGYVGLPLAIRFSECGFKVVGFDIDVEKATLLHSGSSYIDSVSSERVKQAIGLGFEVTSDYEEAKRLDVVLICVPTPLSEGNEPDLSYVLNSTAAVVPQLKSGVAVVLESTTYPGCTEEIICSELTKHGFKIGTDVFVIYSPEREDPGNLKFSVSNTPKICGGITDRCLEIGIAIYSQIVSNVVPVSSPKVAEMAKLLENIHRAVNIGLVNEMKVICDKMGIDVWEVIDAAATKPFGFVPYYPGPGLGGHCIPIDPFYLTWKARQFGVDSEFIQLAGEINHRMPDWVVNKTREALAQIGKSLQGCRVLVLGIAYKKDVSDSRESPGIEIIQLLVDAGAVVEYSDPHIPVFPKKRDYEFKLNSVELDAATIGSFDCVIVATDHAAFDFEFILEHGNLIVDSRGVYRSQLEKVRKA